MSVIAAKKDDDSIVIGADSQITRGRREHKEVDCKLETVNDITIGTTGTKKDHSYLTLYLQNHTPEGNGKHDWIRLFRGFEEWGRKKDDSYSIQSRFLIVYENKIWYFSCFDLEEFDDYYAIGSGADFALSALYLGHSIEEAVEAACEFSLYCEEPISITEL